MIQQESRLKVADNAGARSPSVFSVAGSALRAGIGDVVAAVDARPGTAASERRSRQGSDRSRKETRRPDGSYIRFDENTASSSTIMASRVARRIFGPWA